MTEAELTNRISSRVGYIESENKQEFIKGALLALSIIEGETIAWRDSYLLEKEHRKNVEHELFTISKILKKYSD